MNNQFFKRIICMVLSAVLIIPAVAANKSLLDASADTAYDSSIADAINNTESWTEATASSFPQFNGLNPNEFSLTDGAFANPAFEADENLPYDTADLTNWNTTASNALRRYTTNTSGYMQDYTVVPATDTYALEIRNTVYQVIPCSSNSSFAWNVDHMAKQTDNIVALIIGREQSVGPSAGTNGDQFQQLVAWLKLNSSRFSLPAVNEKVELDVYSKSFSTNGNFAASETASDSKFSFIPTIDCSEKWNVVLLHTDRIVNNSNNSASAPFTTYNGIYNAGANQYNTIFAMLPFDGDDSDNTIGNLVNNVKFVPTSLNELEYSNLQNGSFEDPDIEGSSYEQISDNDIPYWSTTATDKKIEMYTKTSTAYFVKLSGHQSEQVLCVDGNQGAELNCTENSSLYQYIATDGGSTYKWGLGHRGRLGTDGMALIIGPKQDVDPSKTSKTGNDQFMLMSQYIKDNISLLPGMQTQLDELTEGNKTPLKITLYSKKFSTKGTFVNGDGNDMSFVQNDIYTEKWDIWLIYTKRDAWQTYGYNEDDSYNRYIVPQGQGESIFAFVSYYWDEEIYTGKTDPDPTYGNFLDGIKFNLYHPADSTAYTGGTGLIEYLFDNELKTEVVDENASVEVPTLDDGSSINIYAYPNYAKDNQGEYRTYLKDDGTYGYIQNAFLGAYVTINGTKKFVSALSSSTGLKFERRTKQYTLDDGTTVQGYYYVYGEGNLTGKVSVQIAFSEIYTVSYISNGGAFYVVNSSSTPDVKKKGYGTGISENLNNENIARFIGLQDGEYTSAACSYISDNPNVKFVGWELVGENPVLFDAVTTVSYAVPENFVSGVNDTDFEISDSSGHTASTNAYLGAVFVAQWKFIQTVEAQTKIPGSEEYVTTDIGGTVEITEHTADINNEDGNRTDGSKLVFSSELSSIVTLKATEKTDYKFVGWYDSANRKVSESKVYKCEITDDPQTLYARFVYNTYTVKFHINDPETVDASENPDADLFRTYYPASILDTGFSVTNVLTNEKKIETFYDIPTTASKKVFAGWYYDPYLTNRPVQ